MGPLTQRKLTDRFTHANSIKFIGDHIACFNTGLEMREKERSKGPTIVLILRSRQNRVCVTSGARGRLNILSEVLGERNCPIVGSKLEVKYELISAKLFCPMRRGRLTGGRRSVSG